MERCIKSDNDYPICKDSCAYTCAGFSVLVWTLGLTLAFVSVSMYSCASAFVKGLRLFGIMDLRLRCLGFV